MFLEFEGVDGFADIYLDGALLGATNNRFRSYTFNVTSSLKQTSLLELKFSPIVKVANRLFRAYKVDRLVESLNRLLFRENIMLRFPLCALQKSKMANVMSTFYAKHSHPLAGTG